MATNYKIRRYLKRQTEKDKCYTAVTLIRGILKKKVKLRNRIEKLPGTAGWGKEGETGKRKQTSQLQDE